MCVERRGARRLVFLRCKHSGKLTVLIRPRRLVGVEGICQTAPAHIAREHLLLLRRCCTSLSFNLLERSDGGKVVAILGLRAALAEMIIRDAEVLCSRLTWLMMCRFFHAKPFNDHIIGQAVFLTRIDGFRFCCKCVFFLYRVRRKQTRIALIQHQQLFKALDAL